MIEGCINYNCSVTKKTEGQFTCFCSCVRMSLTECNEVQICIRNVPVGPAFPTQGTQSRCDLKAVKSWLENGGLRDILVLERLSLSI